MSPHWSIVALYAFLVVVHWRVFVLDKRERAAHRAWAEAHEAESIRRHNDFMDALRRARGETPTKMAKA